jgi:hypothetical protein
MSDGPDVRPEDALQVAQRALAKINEYEDRVDDLEGDVMELQLRLSEIDENRPYEALSLDEKIGMVREHAYKKARDGHGKAMLDYDDIMWEIFDGEPGNNLCYKLIRLAAGLTDNDDGGDRPTGSKFPGFKARDPDGGNYHLAVDAEEAKQSAAFSSRNKTTPAGGRSA